MGFCVSGSLLSSCVDDTSNLGLELQNPDDRVYVFNDSSMHVNTYTYQRADSIYLSPGYMLLGYNNDAKLGQFENNFMTEVTLSSSSVDFGEEPIEDSLILYLDYSYAYGDTNQTQNITVYELEKEMSLNNISNSINGRPMEDDVIEDYYDKNNVLTTFSFTPNPSDSLPLRIIMPDELRDRILDTTYYDSLNRFNENVFRGFYFVAEQIDGGGVTYFNTGSLTRMELYYHNENDTSTYEYSINEYSYRCNIFKRTPNPDIKVVEVGALPIESDEQELFYIKNSNGYEGRIDISGLQEWADTLGYYSINKALLTIYTEQPTNPIDSLYYPHSSIQVLKLDTSDYKKRSYLVEYITTNEYLNIPFTLLPDSTYGYQININSTLFNAINNGEDKLSLILTTNRTTNIASANRTILKGATDTESPLKLKLTYTKFNAE